MTHSLCRRKSTSEKTGCPRVSESVQDQSPHAAVCLCSGDFLDLKVRQIIHVNMEVIRPRAREYPSVGGPESRGWWVAEVQRQHPTPKILDNASCCNAE